MKLGSAAGAVLIFMAMLAVYWIPAALAIGALVVIYKAVKSIYQLARAHNRRRRIHKLNKPQKEEPYDDEADFVNSLNQTT